jgi:hypothetical protein
MCLNDAPLSRRQVAKARRKTWGVRWTLILGATLYSPSLNLILANVTLSGMLTLPL